MHEIPDSTFAPRLPFEKRFSRVRNLLWIFALMIGFTSRATDFYFTNFNAVTVSDTPFQIFPVHLNTNGNTIITGLPIHVPATNGIATNVSLLPGDYELRFVTSKNQNLLTDKFYFTVVDDPDTNNVIDLRVGSLSQGGDVAYSKAQSNSRFVLQDSGSATGLTSSNTTLLGTVTFGGETRTNWPTGSGAGATNAVSSLNGLSNVVTLAVSTNTGSAFAFTLTTNSQTLTYTMTINTNLVSPSEQAAMGQVLTNHALAMGQVISNAYTAALSTQSNNILAMVVGTNQFATTNTEFQTQINAKSDSGYPMSFVFLTNAPVTDVYNFAVVNAYSPRTKTIYRTFWENNSGQAGTSFGAWQKFSYSTNFGTTWSTPTTIYSNSFYYAANHAFGVTPTGRLINFVEQHIYTNSVIQTNGHSIFTLISDDGGANWTSNVFEFLPWTANSTNLVVPHGRINVTPSGKLVGSIYITTIGASATETAYCIASTNNGVNWDVIGTITNSVTNNVRLNEVQIWPVNDTFFLAATRNGGSTHSYIFASTNAGLNWYVATDLLQPSGNTGESSPCSLVTYPGIDGEHMVIAHGDRTKHNMYITDGLISEVIDLTGVRNDAGGTLLSNRWQLVQTNSYSQDIAYPSLISLSGSQLLLSYSFATNNSSCYIVDKIVQPTLRVNSVSISGTNTSGYLVATNLSTNSFVSTSANGKDLISRIVSWNDLSDIPAGFSDGTDDGAGGGSGVTNLVIVNADQIANTNKLTGAISGATISLTNFNGTNFFSTLLVTNVYGDTNFSTIITNGNSLLLSNIFNTNVASPSQLAAQGTAVTNYGNATFMLKVNTNFDSLNVTNSISGNTFVLDSSLTITNNAHEGFDFISPHQVDPVASFHSSDGPFLEFQQPLRIPEPDATNAPVTLYYVTNAIAGIDTGGGGGSGSTNFPMLNVTNLAKVGSLTVTNGASALKYAFRNYFLKMGDSSGAATWAQVMAHPRVRRTSIWLYNGGTVPAVGDPWAISGGSLGSAVDATATSEPYAPLPTGITPATRVNLDANGFRNHHFGRPWYLSSASSISSTNNVRFIMGMTRTSSGNLYATNTPTGGGDYDTAMIRYSDNAANTTNYCLVTYNGSDAAQVTDTGVQANTSRHVFEIVSDGSSMVWAWIDGVCVATNTVSVPTSDSCQPTTGAVVLDTTSKDVNIRWLCVSEDNP